jgi:8-oxo-dGTP pyrophosphatase MutT (NUDIX family)
LLRPTVRLGGAAGKMPAMTAQDRRFEPIGGRTVYEGRILTLRVERFRFADGEEVEREIVRHRGAAGVVAHDDEHLWLVRQPREAVNDHDFLEVPAGRLDQEGESPQETAARELAEEVGLAAESWAPIASFASSVGMSDEIVHLFHATGLSRAQRESDENERIEIVRWPLADLDGAIAAARDAKTLVGLLWLKTRLR